MEEEFITIELTDGRTVDFPAGMSKDEMAAALKKLPKGEAQKSFLDRAGDALKSTVDWFKGGQREDNIPLASGAKLGLPKDKAAKMVALLATTASDDRLQSGIKGIMPNAQFDKDQYGNLVVIAPVYREGKETQQYTRFYPNPKGLDATDLMIGSGAMALGEAIAMTGGALGLPVAGVTGGALIGATEAGVVEAVSSYLTNDKYQYGDIPGGAIGGGLGAKAFELLGKLYRTFKRAPGAVFGTNGELPKNVQDQLRAAGIDPATVTRETMQKIEAQVKAGIDPAEAGRLAEAETLPVPVPLTKGAVTGSQGQQLFENAAEMGGYGSQAESMMRGAREQTQDALQANIPEIRDRIGDGSPTVTGTGQAGAAAQDVLVAQEAAARQRANEMYDAARAKGPAFMDEDAAIAMTGRIETQLSEGFEFVNVPKTAGALNKLKDLVSSGGSIRDMFALRTQVTNLAKEIGSEGAAARQLKNLLDAELGDALDNALIYGDEIAVNAWKSAISNYKDFANTWQSKGGLLKTLTERVSGDGEDLALKVTPEQASNVIFQVTSNRLSTNPKAASNIIKMKNNLPKEEWDMIRQEAFLRITRAGKSQKAGRDVFSGVNFRKEWEKLRTDNPTMINALFTPEERKLITQFANVAARSTGGAVNASNTANSAFNIMGRIMTALGGTGTGRFAMELPFINMARSGYGMARTGSAISGNPSPRAQGSGAGAGGVIANEEELQNYLATEYGAAKNLLKLGPQ
jgi:hypothetical protein